MNINQPLRKYNTQAIGLICTFIYKCPVMSLDRKNWNMIKTTHRRNNDKAELSKITVSHYITIEDINNFIFEELMTFTPENEITTKSIESGIKDKLKYVGCSFFDYYDDSLYKYDDNFAENKQKAIELTKKLFPNFK